MLQMHNHVSKVNEPVHWPIEYMPMLTYVLPPCSAFELKFFFFLYTDCVRVTSQQFPSDVTVKTSYAKMVLFTVTQEQPSKSE